LQKGGGGPTGEDAQVHRLPSCNPSGFPAKSSVQPKLPYGTLPCCYTDLLVSETAKLLVRYGSDKPQFKTSFCTEACLASPWMQAPQADQIWAHAIVHVAVVARPTPSSSHPDLCADPAWSAAHLWRCLSLLLMESDARWMDLQMQSP